MWNRNKERISELEDKIYRLERDMKALGEDNADNRKEIAQLECSHKLEFVEKDEFKPYLNPIGWEPSYYKECKKCGLEKRITKNEYIKGKKEQLKEESKKLKEMEEKKNV